MLKQDQIIDILDNFKTVLFSLAGAGRSDFLPSQKSYQKIYFDSPLIHLHSCLGVKPTHLWHYFKKTNHLVCQWETGFI
jgi:hypothetical protein